MDNGFAVEYADKLNRNGIEVDTEAKVILWSERQPGIQLLGAIDYLKGKGFNQLGEVATESFRKAREIARKRKEKKA